jgi:putative membrane protein
MKKRSDELLAGSLAGLAATLPMTWVMELLHRRLPPEERYPLPPREIAMALAGQAGIQEELSEPQRLGLTLAGHFAYGAAAGALYVPLAQALPAPSALAGAGYGLAVWAGSYLGLLPGLGILRPATEHPVRRTALMITAHLVWGLALGVLAGGPRHAAESYPQSASPEANPSRA